LSKKPPEDYLKVNIDDSFCIDLTNGGCSDILEGKKPRFLGRRMEGAGMGLLPFLADE
jgi:hypothetical protein